MKKRMNLQKLLLKIGEDHKLSIYYQPPANVKMTYPCIVYELMDGNDVYADNVVYLNNARYQITLITKSPDPESFEAILQGVPYCSFRNKIISDNLHNYVFYCYM